MLPSHLKRYVVDQDYSRYTPVDQAVWRYIMRQLTDYLAVHAHPCYLEGLEKTGIHLDRIPNIEEMSEKLEKFGWRAIPVSGFIPPAAFMELQSLGYLPIASDLRTIDHLMYTPAPDIVHEAAGHAPILIDPEFAAYLKSYAQVARKAIISREDMDQYAAIRTLSDLKEDPSSTPDEVRAAEQKLDHVTRSISHVSEAALLGRMNWWTAEYGLIGSLDQPRIFGAGLLSSVGEARSCLSPKVKKLPLTIDCIDYSYDITEPQPQLFVAPDFSRLIEVLEELSSQLAYRTGGLKGLEKAIRAETVNTIQLNSGLQISARLKNVICDSAKPAYLQFDGPTQLCLDGEQINNQGVSHHPHGFGSPVGHLISESKCLSQMSESEHRRLGIVLGRKAELKFTSGVVVSGHVASLTRDPDSDRLLIVSFTDCWVKMNQQILFDPAWGVFDMAVGSSVTSVFGGPADRSAYGETDDFAAKVIPKKSWSPLIVHKHELYQKVREIREGLSSRRLKPDESTSQMVDLLLEQVESNFPHDWLIRLEILELGRKLPSESWRPRVELELRNLSDSDSDMRIKVADGLRVMN